MEIKLRQRLIGAVVLGALAVIFVPLLFKTPSHAPKQITLDAPIPPAPAKPSAQQTVLMMQGNELNPQRPQAAANNNSEATDQAVESKSETPQLNSAKQSTSAVASVPESQQSAVKSANTSNQQSPAEEVVLPMDIESSGGEPAKEQSTKPAKPAKRSTNNKSELAAQKTKTTPADKHRSHVDAVSAAAKPVVTAAPKLAKANAWVIQLGSFTDPARAKELIKQLRDKGFKAFGREMKTAQGMMTRVFIGPEIKKDKLAVVQAQLNKDMKVKGMVVAFNPTQVK